MNKNPCLPFTIIETCANKSIVIILIAMEIFVACVNIAVDVWAGDM